MLLRDLPALQWHRAYLHPDIRLAQSLAVEVICYWAVPIFFMLTGATLMNYRSKYDTKTFFGHRIKRTVIPFLFFSVFMYILYVYEFKTLKPITSVRAFADAVFNC